MKTSAVKKAIGSLTLLLTISACILGQKPPKGFLIPESSLSPDHRYGVAVPIFAEHIDLSNPNKGVIEMKDNPRNSVIEVKTGRFLAAIKGETGWDRPLNHIETLPARWSRDASLLLWEVDGKWSPWVLTAVKIENGGVKWQIDLLKTAQQAILLRTKEAAPEKYAVAKKANKGNGRAFPEGFTVDVEVQGAIEIPFRVRAVLTSNPKDLEGFPQLDSYLDGIVDKNGTLSVTDFQLRRVPAKHF